MNTDTELIKRDGKVALEQTGNRQQGVLVTTKDGTAYRAIIQHDVWLIWADENHLEELLQKKVKSCDCGGGTNKPLYQIASAVNVSVHLTGDRPH